MVPEEVADAGDPLKGSGAAAGNGAGSAAMFGGGRRRGPGEGEREAELERLAAMKRRNAETRSQRERDANLQHEKDVELAVAYAERKKAQSQQRQEAQQARSHQSQMSSKMSSPSRRIPLDEELAQDAEYRELYERYGDRLRVPQPPSPRPPRPLNQTLRKPAVPSQPRKQQLPCGNGVVSAPANETEPIATTASRAAAPRRMSSTGHDVIAGGGSGHAGGRASASAGHGTNAAGRMSGSGATLPPITVSPRGVAVGEEQALADGAGQEEIPEPDRSLMPRKEMLRKRQQVLLKKTDVSFYRKQMNAHFQKILEACELTYTESSKRKAQAPLNLAQPDNEQKHSVKRA